jgi:hypothetical protein
MRITTIGLHIAKKRREDAATVFWSCAALRVGGAFEMENRRRRLNLPRGWNK